MDNLIDFLDFKRQETLKTLVKTISEAIQKNQQIGTVDTALIKQNIIKAKRKADALQDNIDTQEEELSNLESEVLKQKRKIEDLNNEIKSMEVELSKFD